MKIIFSLLIFISFVFQAKSQSDIIYAEAYLNSINGPGYVAPFSDVVSANLNTQLFPFRNSSKISFHIGLIASRSIIPSGMKTHFGTSVGLEPNETHEVPTVFGENKSKLVADLNNNVYIFPGGFALNQLTFLVPQISVSGIANTDFTFRYFEWSFNEDFEDIRLIGGGIRHHFTNYISLPDNVNLSLAYAFNYVEADAKTISNTSHLVLFEGSYEPSIWRVFGNVAYVDSKVKIDYFDPETSIQFETNGGQNLRIGLGAGVQLSVVNLSVQVDIFAPITYSGFIGISF